MVTVEVNCVKLVEDADRWRTAADAMGKAARTAGELAMSVKQFGAIADERGVVSSYGRLQKALTRLVTGAEAEFRKIGDTLTLVAQTYLMEDQAGAHAMGRLKDEL